MKRALFSFERFLSVGGRHPWNVLLAVRLRGRIEEGSLRDALSCLQVRHPMLRVSIVNAGKCPHFTRRSLPIPLRILARADPESWFGELCSELERPFSIVEGPLLRLVWLRDEAVSELILIGDHCICDGRSVQLLMRELIDHLREPGQVVVPQDEVLTIDTLFGSGTPASKRDRRSLLSYAGAMKWLLSATSTYRRKPTALAIAPSYVLRWDLDEGACHTLRERCRHEKITPYAALATVLLRAFRSVRPREARNRLLCPVDVRTLTPAIGADMLFGFADTIHLCTDRRLDHDFWQQAHKLRTDLLARRARLDPKRTIQTIEYLHGLSDWFVDLQLQGRARNDLMFSYISELNIPHLEQPLKVEAVLGFLASMPWRGSTAVFSLRDCGRMRFFLVSREASLPQVEAERIRDVAMSMLTVQLGAPMLRR